MLALFHGANRHSNGSEEDFDQNQATEFQRASSNQDSKDTTAGGVRLPLPAFWIKDGLLEKRVIGNGTTSWQRRHVVLDIDRILITRPESERVVESIPLHEVTRVREIAEEEHHLRPAGSDSGDPKMYQRQKTFRGMKPPAEQKMLFEVSTTEDGFNGGRAYCLQCAARSEGEEWIAAINKWANAAAVRRHLKREESRLSSFQKAVKDAYDSEISQTVVAVLIMTNFATSIVEAELVPEEGTRTYGVLSVIDFIFTIVFAIELVLNMFGNWVFVKPNVLPNFFHDGWNIFDLIVVAVSVFAAAFQDAPGVNALRIMRVFRVMRVFRRLGSLRVLINALTSSIVPVLNAFVVLMLVTAVYAVLAVLLFGDSEDAHAKALFGNFSSSIFTMFQICTGDGWASTIVRPLWKDPARVDPVLALFFISYILIVGTFLINIVIAVLLDEFISSVEAEKSMVKKMKKEEHAVEFQKSQGVLDPVIKALTTFTTPEDLDNEIDHLYDQLDTDESGGLTFDELHEGLKKLLFEPRIHINEEDFDAITEGRNLVNEEGEVDRPSFFAIVKRQMVAYVQKWLTHKMRDAEDEQYTMLVALKQLMLLSNNQGQEERTEMLLDDIKTRLVTVEQLLRGKEVGAASDGASYESSVEEHHARDEERRMRLSGFDRHISNMAREHNRSTSPQGSMLLRAMPQESMRIRSRKADPPPKQKPTASSCPGSPKQQPHTQQHHRKGTEAGSPDSSADEATRAHSVQTPAFPDDVDLTKWATWAQREFKNGGLDYSQSFISSKRTLPPASDDARRRSSGSVPRSDLVRSGGDKAAPGEAEKSPAPPHAAKENGATSTPPRLLPADTRSRDVGGVPSVTSPPGVTLPQDGQPGAQEGGGAPRLAPLHRPSSITTPRVLETSAISAPVHDTNPESSASVGPSLPPHDSGALPLHPSPLPNAPTPRVAAERPPSPTPSRLLGAVSPSRLPPASIAMPSSHRGGAGLQEASQRAGRRVEGVEWDKPQSVAAGRGVDAGFVSAQLVMEPAEQQRPQRHQARQAR